MVKYSYVHLTVHDSRSAARVSLPGAHVLPLSRTMVLVKIGSDDMQRVKRIPGLRKVTMQLDVDEGKCNGCNNCVVACPANFDVLDELLARDEPFTSDKYVIRVANGNLSANRLDKCRRITERRDCVICKLVCPFEAVNVIS